MATAERGQLAVGLRASAAPGHSEGGAITLLFYFVGVPWVLVSLVFVLVWAGSALLLDAWQRRGRPSLTERLLPFQRGWVADEAQRWLRDRDRPGRDDG